MKERIGVIGLGYVGLPVALAFARKFPDTVGFDIHREKVDELRRGTDRNGEQSPDTLRATTLKMTSDPNDLRSCTLFVVAVPTPVDANNVPDLTPIERASETVGRVLSKGRRRRLRVDRVSRRHRGSLRPDPRASERSEARRRFQARLLARADQPGRQGAHAREDHQGGQRRRCGDARSRRRQRTARSSTPACTAPRASRSPRRPR